MTSPLDQKKIKIFSALEDYRQRSFAEFADIVYRPGPNPVGKAKQRSTVRHAGETETTIPICLD